MNRTRISFAVAAFLVAVPLLAANLGKFNDWGDSPEGYFMTKAEREQWKTISNAADAEKFVADFLSKRDAGFSAEVAKRAEMADKYLTLGSTPGSKSLRGKVVILFGPPTGMDVSSRTKTNTKRDNPFVSSAMSNANSGGGGGGRGGDSGGSTGGSLSTAQDIRTYSITFSGDASKKTIDKPSVTFVLDADTVSGKDEWASRSAGKEAEDYFELVARNSIKK
jgi:GWxTD domain-containing protein